MHTLYESSLTGNYQPNALHIQMLLSVGERTWNRIKFRRNCVAQQFYFTFQILFYSIPLPIQTSSQKQNC